jgi:hypothetical protein
MNKDNNKKANSLEEAIVGAIAFFDMFDFPLTDFEIWKFVNIRCDLADVKLALENLSGIENKNGFYFLRDRSEIVDVRLKRNIYTERKFKRARRIAKIFRFIPWIEMIAVSNIIGERNLKDESDIDFFIITENKKIWLTRFFCAGIAKILGMRPEKGNERDKICLNFYASEEVMNLSELMMDNDIYFRYWVVNLVPIYDIGDAYKKFIQANGWLKNCFPNWLPEENSGLVLKNKPSKFNLLNLFFGKFENKFKKLELKLMPPEMKEMMNKDTRVVVNDKILKLHVKDRRHEYRKRFLNKMSSLLSS